MKTTNSISIRRRKNRTVAALCGIVLAGSLAVSQSARAQEVRSAKVLAIHTLAPVSLTQFGHTAAELATAQANGLTRTDLPAIGSGLQRLAGNHFVSVTDRGPTFTRTAPTPGRVFPLPTYTPHLVFFRAGGGTIILQTIMPIVVDDAGTPATGISNSALDDSVPFDSPTATSQLPFNPNGLDLEDVHSLSDGNFIVVDEYSPSLAIISDAGKVLKRYTPTGKLLPGAAYEVSDTLPGVLAQRRANRGIECIAISGDGKTAYTMTQSPLGPTSPASAPTRNSRVLRLLRLDVSEPLDAKVTGQFVLLMSPATNFPTGNRPQDLKLSAAAWVSENKLLLLERSDELGIGGAKLILADLTDATDISTRPPGDAVHTLALENSSLDLSTMGITPVATTVVYSNEETPELDDFKLEGLAILNRNDVALTNDNDFGIGVPAEASSRMWIIRLREPLP
jgi:alkaline phosphatase